MTGGNEGWVGVDLDGTLAEYGTWVSPVDIGNPVPKMAERVRAWLNAGQAVRIFTARVYPINECVGPDDILRFQPATPRERDAVAALRAIQAWTKAHFGVVLPVTNVKDYGMMELYDDRCVQVETNTGKIIGRARL